MRSQHLWRRRCGNSTHFSMDNLSSLRPTEQNFVVKDAINSLIDKKRAEILKREKGEGFVAEAGIDIDKMANADEKKYLNALQKQLVDLRRVQRSLLEKRYQTSIAGGESDVRFTGKSDADDFEKMEKANTLTQEPVRGESGHTVENLKTPDFSVFEAKTEQLQAVDILPMEELRAKHKELLLIVEGLKKMEPTPMVLAELKQREIDLEKVRAIIQSKVESEFFEQKDERSLEIPEIVQEKFGELSKKIQKLLEKTKNTLYKNHQDTTHADDEKRLLVEIDAVRALLLDVSPSLLDQAGLSKSFVLKNVDKDSHKKLLDYLEALRAHEQYLVDRRLKAFKDKKLKPSKNAYEKPLSTEATGKDIYDSRNEIKAELKTLEGRKDLLSKAKRGALEARLVKVEKQIKEAEQVLRGRSVSIDTGGRARHMGEDPGVRTHVRRERVYDEGPQKPWVPFESRREKEVATDIGGIVDDMRAGGPLFSDGKYRPGEIRKSMVAMRAETDPALRESMQGFIHNMDSALEGVDYGRLSEAVGDINNRLEIATQNFNRSVNQKDEEYWKNQINRYQDMLLDASKDIKKVYTDKINTEFQRLEQDYQLSQSQINSLLQGKKPGFSLNPFRWMKQKSIDKDIDLLKRIISEKNMAIQRLNDKN